MPRVCGDEKRLHGIRGEHVRERDGYANGILALWLETL
jgi:hypothetical protein